VLVLNKDRALDRMLWLSRRHHIVVPPEFVLAQPAPLRWTAAPDGRRTLAGEVVLRPAAAAPVLAAGDEPQAAKQAAPRLTPIGVRAA
jgi:hypothetical protein